MSRAIVPVSHIDNTVTRNVVKDVLTSIMFYTNMPEIKNITYIPRGGVADQKQHLSEEETLKLEVNNFITVEYEEKFDELIYDVNIYQTEYPAIFKASKLGISARPMHSRVILKMDVTYTNKSYNSILMWLNNFKRIYQQSSLCNLHNIQFNYNVPDDVLAYIMEVYTLQENVSGYGISLSDFIRLHFTTNGVVIRHNQNNTKTQMAINTIFTGVVGVFTEHPQDTIDNSKEPPMSSVKFSYEVEYDRVSAIALDYQHYIHNQVIDISMLKKYYDRQPHWDAHSGNAPVSGVINKLTKNFYGANNYSGDYSYTGDGWISPTPPDSMEEIMVAPVQLDLNNLTELINTSILVNYNIPDWYIPLINQFNVPVTQPYKWFLYFQLFEVNASVTPMAINVSTNGDITSVLNLNPRNRYYFRVLKNTKLTQVDFTWLLNYPSQLQLILQNYNPNTFIRTIGNGTRVDKNSLDDSLTLINPVNIYGKPAKTVMVSDIIVRRK